MDEKRIIERFLEYIQIDSESRNEKKFADRLVKDLTELGLRVVRDDSGAKAGSDTDNIIAYLDGDPALEPLMLSAHLDTVPPGKDIVPVIENGVIRSAGNTILGSDDKSGVVAIVEAVKTVIEENLPHRPVEMVFTVCEEVGLLGAKYLDYSLVKSKNAIAFDSGGDVGTIVNLAPGHIEIEATITGKAAHAGVAPETGISAIEAAAHAVSAMKLLRVDPETTANVGTFTAVGPNNIVPEKALLKMEVRSRNAQKLQEHSQHLIDCMQSACDKFGAQLHYTAETSYVTYHIPQDDPLIKLISESCEKIGAKVFIKPTGGGSDANFFNANGLHAVVIGTGMTDVHGVNESITVKNLVDCARLTLEMIKA